MSESGFSVSLLRVTPVVQGWDDAAATVRTAVTALDAGGAWSPRLATAVASFNRQWREDLEGVAVEAEATGRTLGAALDAYQSADGRSGRRLSAGTS